MMVTFETSDAIGDRLDAGAHIVGVRCGGWVVDVTTPADLARADALVCRTN